MVKIISDSTSDLSQDLLDRYNITLVPLIVRLGDQQYEDRVNITSEEIFRWSDSTKKAPTTACANVWAIQEVFQKYLETYDEIVAFSISGKMSATGRTWWKRRRRWAHPTASTSWTARAFPPASVCW